MGRVSVNDLHATVEFANFHVDWRFVANSLVPIPFPHLGQNFCWNARNSEVCMDGCAYGLEFHWVTSVRLMCEPITEPSLVTSVHMKITCETHRTMNRSHKIA